MAEEDLRENEEENVLDDVWEDRSIWNEGEEVGDTLTGLDRWDDMVKDLLPGTDSRPREESHAPQAVVDLKSVKTKPKAPVAPIKAPVSEKKGISAVSDKDLLLLIRKYKAAERICEVSRIPLQTLQRRVAHLSYRLKRYIDVEGLYRDTGALTMTQEGILIPKGHLIDTGFRVGDRFNVVFKDDLVILARQRK